jgi:AcrR family transcriptional regulator
MPDLSALLEAASPGKRAILTSALRLFAARGVDAVSVRDIAALSGFTNPALFRHFASKDDLARVLFEACYVQLVEAVEAAAEDDEPRAWLAAVLREVARSPAAVHFVLDNVRRYWGALPEALQARGLPAHILRWFEREQGLGRVRPGLDLQLAGTVVYGALAQIARSAHIRKTALDPDAMARDLADLLVRGFGPGG